MKTLLISILFCVSVITQAQQRITLENYDISSIQYFVDYDTISMYFPDSTSANTYDFEIMLPQYERLKPGLEADMFRAIYNYISKLEKTVNRLYQKQQQDSIKYASEAWIREKERQGICVEIEPTRPDTIWIDSEMDFYNGKVPVIRLRK